jgi:acetylornithine deacetylase/succinyl-diaminopimelate desuccinylase-like protein
MVMRNTEYVTGKKAILRGGAAGTDSRHPVLYGGIPTVAGWKGVGWGGHSVDEWADLDTTILASKLLALNILEWCGHVS